MSATSEAAPHGDAFLSSLEATELLRQMMTIRHFDDRVVQLRIANEIDGPVHPYTGEEAVAVGVCANLTRGDTIVSTHRGHGHCIAKGADLGRMMAELFGRANGYCKGKGGSMHIADFSIGVLGANGIVAAGLPIASGAALAAKLAGTDAVSVSFFGDGASGAGPFHESLNVAAAWKLPIIFVCENNGWAAGTSIEDGLGMPSISAMGAGYGIPGVAVDGNDVLAVRAAVETAVNRARAGEGPTLIEAQTYRRRAHAYRLPVKETRDPAILEEWDRRDPIKRLRDRLIDDGTLTAADADALDRETAELIETAIEFARSGPLPRPEDALEDVFA